MNIRFSFIYFYLFHDHGIDMTLYKLEWPLSQGHYNITVFYWKMWKDNIQTNNQTVITRLFTMIVKISRDLYLNFAFWYHKLLNRLFIIYWKWMKIKLPEKKTNMSIEHTGMALTLMSAPLFRSCCTMSFLLTGLFLSIATCNGNRPIWKHIYKVLSKIIWIQ